MNKTNKLKVIPLGGVGEIGKNFFVVEYEDDILIIDCGITFPEAEMLGIDVVIPDFTYIKDNIDRVRGLVITHGHEDHLGAIPYLLKEVGTSFPIYGTELSLGLLKNKLKEHRIRKVQLRTAQYNNIIKFGKMEVEYIQTTHSIPQASHIAVKTPEGTIIHTGDFKIDLTPIDGGRIDLNKLAKYGDEGVLMLISDSTNAQIPGSSMSESVVGQTFNNLFMEHRDKRMIIATFASNVHRVQQIITAAEKFGRKVVLSGRSMLNVVETARNLDILKVKKNTIININQMNNFKPEELVFITTGSQGEPFSALTRISSGDHRQISVDERDVVILSASSIPGNELAITEVVNNLMARGTEVIYKTLSEIHVSGHACADELKMMMSLTKPKYLMPFHGEMLQTKAHANLGKEMGIPDENILLVENGTTIEFNKGKAKLGRKVPAGRVLVDGLGIGDVGNIVLRDRKWLSEDGLIIAVFTISDGKVIAGPDIISRGFVYVRESGDLMYEAQQVAKKTLNKLEKQGRMGWDTLKNEVQRDLNRFIYKEIRRKPMILPIVMEV